MVTWGMTVPNLPSHYHVGIVVADLHAARDRLREALGVEWGPVLHLDAVAYRDGAGADVELPTTMCHSTGDPCLELIEEVPGSIWVTNEHSNLHHLGFWADGLEVGSAALAGGGCPLQLTGRDHDRAPVSFAHTTAWIRSACGSSSSMPPCVTAWRSCSSPRVPPPDSRGTVQADTRLRRVLARRTPAPGRAPVAPTPCASAGRRWVVGGHRRTDAGHRHRGAGALGVGESA
jgi:hypothetical protein